MSALSRSTRIQGLNAMSDAEVALNDANDAQRKALEHEAKKAEVRRRLEEAGNKNKNKKGFLTPERKKKLRKLLMVKAAEDLKRQQVEKEQERLRILAERTVALPDVDSVNDKDKLETIFKDLEQRIFQLESDKYDINYEVTQRDSVINQLTIEVNDLRGKYVKPTLKKVSKYDNKFKKTAEAAAAANEGKKLDFRASLKVVKKDVMDEITNVKKKDDKPEWSKKNVVKEEEQKEEEAKEDNHDVAEKEEELPTEQSEAEDCDEEESEDEE